MDKYSGNSSTRSTSSTSPLSHPHNPFSMDTATRTSENRRKDPKVSRACDSCKMRKIRCTGTLPCANCLRRQYSCAYRTKYARGRPPTPPPMIKENEAAGTGVTSDPPVGDANAPRSCNGYSDASMANDASSKENQSLPVEIGTSRASPELEIEGQFFDCTSGLTFLHRAWAKLLSKTSGAMHQSPNEVERYQLLMSAGDQPFYSDGQGSDRIPDDITARRLLTFYFDSCVVTYRIFHRQTVENWLEVVLKNNSEHRQLSHSLGNAKCAIVLTLLAIAGFRTEKLRDGSYSRENENLALRDNDRLFCLAMSLTESEMGFPCLESAQARLIQVLYLLQTSRMNKAWYTIGQAYQILSSLGLHRRLSRRQGVSCAKGNNEYISIQCARRFFWVTYTIDMYLSVVFGRPRFLHDEDIDQEFPERMNDEDMGPHGPCLSEPSEDCHIDSVISHAKISRIVGRISREVYPIDTKSNADRALAAQHFVSELHEWRARLPPHLGTVKASTLMPQFRRQYSALRLAYHHAIIHANRPFLLVDWNNSSHDVPHIQDRVTECISAAKVALELVNSMACDNNLFHSLWWTHYVTFCALAVVYVWRIRCGSQAPSDDKFQPSAELLDLAAKCQSHLLQASSAASPSQRYGVILEELRLAAHEHDLSLNCGANNNSFRPEVIGSIQTTGETFNPQMNLSEVAQVDGITSSYEYSQISGDGFPDASPPLLNFFPLVNWSDLDSSAFYHVPEFYGNSIPPRMY